LGPSRARDSCPIPPRGSAVCAVQVSEKFEACCVSNAYDGIEDGAGVDFWHGSL
jgi:hypothetical protein